MARKWLFFALLAIGIVTFSAYFYNQKNNDKETPKTQLSINIGYPKLKIALPVFVAQENGYFKKHGVPARLIGYETAQPMMDDLVSGSLDIAGYTALPITFSATARSKTDLIFISGIFEDDSHPISILIAGNDSGIKSARDLGGKRIGILPTRAYEVWLMEILEKNKVEAKTVIIQQIPPPQQAIALKSGAIDALFTNDPAATAALTQGAGTAILDGTASIPKVIGIDPMYFGSFNITSDFATRNPEVTAGISRALDDAIEFIRKNPEETSGIMAKYLPKEQSALAAKFPKSLFKKTNEISQEDLDKMYIYYRGRKLISTSIDVSSAQYRQ